jgi:hypothetical protein
VGALIVELRFGGEWHRAGWPLSADDAPGSMSHNGPAGRQVYVFGCDGPYSLVMRSKAGIDSEHAGGLVRKLAVLEGFEEVARLTPERPSFECWLQTDRMREPMRFRFRHQQEESDR